MLMPKQRELLNSLLKEGLKAQEQNLAGLHAIREKLWAENQTYKDRKKRNHLCYCAGKLVASAGCVDLRTGGKTLPDAVVAGILALAVLGKGELDFSPAEALGERLLAEMGESGKKGKAPKKPEPLMIENKA